MDLICLVSLLLKVCKGMKKDFAGKRFTVKQTTRTRDRKWRWVVWTAISVLFVCLVGFFPYKKTFPLVSSYFVRLKIGIAERKAHLHQETLKAKQIAVKKNEADPEIHFEFYTVLPNMQVTVARLPANESPHTGDRSFTNQMRAAIITVDQLDRELSAKLKYNQKQHRTTAERLPLNVTHK